VIQRKADRGKKANNAAEESDEEQTGVESYTGVGISVSFNSKVLDEQQKIQQLSGGQKSKPLPPQSLPAPTIPLARILTPLAPRLMRPLPDLRAPGGRVEPVRHL
jgi:hypothetical protein